MAHYLDFAKYLLCPLSRENELLLITKLVILAPSLRSVYSSLIILRNRFDMLRVPFEYHWLWSWHTLYHRWNDDNLLPIHKDQSKLSARLQFCLVWVNIFAKQSHITSEIPIHEIKGDYFMENVRTVLKSIWHEHSFLSVMRSLLKNSKLKIWENSVKTTRSYDRLNLPIFRSKCGPFAARPKPGHVTKKRSSWRHLVGSSTALARKHNKHKGRYHVAGYKNQTSCKNTSYTHGVTVHRFPCDPETRAKWTKFLSVYFQKRIM